MVSHTKVFISYSHKDEKWLISLKTHLIPLEREGLIKSWDDKSLKPGVIWEQEIKEALDTAKVAILLVSPHFFESKFISSIELPTLLTAAEAKGTIILSLIVTACDFEHSDLQRFETLNSPDKPLDLIQPKGKQHQELKRVADKIRELVKGSNLENPLSKEHDQLGSGKKATQADDTSPENMKDIDPDTAINSTRSKPPVYSVKLRENAIEQLRHKFSLRWKHFLLPGLVGFVLGLICGGLLTIILPPPDKSDTGEKKPEMISPASVIPTLPNKKEKTVYMVGSGTVFRYLLASNLFERLIRVGKDVPVLEGPTETGVELFGSTNPMTNLPYTNQSIVLVMAAEKQSLDKLQQYPGQPGKIYEIYLGADTLQVLYADVIERRDGLPHADNFFSDKNRSKMTSTDLLKNWGNGYDIYVGKEGSGTRNRWEEYLFGSNTKPVWPGDRPGDNADDNPRIWDIRTMQILAWPKDSKPRIYLGSEVLNETQEKIITDSGVQTILRNPLTMVSENPVDVKRGLYLYGWIDTGDVYGNEGYNLPKPVVDILKYVFDSLEDNTKYLSSYLERDCLNEQRKYFHLRQVEDKGEGWVKRDPPPGQEFYRAETCKGRVEK